MSVFLPGKSGNGCGLAGCVGGDASCRPHCAGVMVLRRVYTEIQKPVIVVLGVASCSSWVRRACDAAEMVISDHRGMVWSDVDISVSYCTKQEYVRWRFLCYQTGRRMMKRCDLFVRLDVIHVGVRIAFER